MKPEKVIPKPSGKRLESDAWKQLEEIIELGLREYLQAQAGVKS